MSTYYSLRRSHLTALKVQVTQNREFVDVWVVLHQTLTVAVTEDNEVMSFNFNNLTRSQ